MGDEQKVVARVPVPGGIVEPPRPDGADGAEPEEKARRADGSATENGMTLFDWLHRTFPGKATFALVGALLVLSIVMVVLALRGGRVIEIGPIKFGNPVVVDKTAIAEVNEQLSKVGKANQELREELENLRARVSAREASTADQLNNSGTRTAALESRQSTTESRLNRIESNFTEHATRIASAEGTLTSHTGQITTVSGSVREASDRVSTVESTVNGMGAALSGIATKVTQGEVRVAEIEGRATNLETQLQTVRGAVSQHDRELENVRGEVERLKVDRAPPAQAPGGSIR